MSVNGNGHRLPLRIYEADRDVGRLVILAAERFGLDPTLDEGVDHGCECAGNGRAGAQVVLICGAPNGSGCSSHAHLAKPFTLAELEEALGEAVSKSGRAVPVAEAADGLDRTLAEARLHKLTP